MARAHALVAQAPDDAREATILVEIAELRRFARDLGGAVAAGDRALMLAERAGQARLRAQAHFQLGVAHLTRGARREGVAHLQSTVASLADAPLRDRLGYPYVTALTRLAWSFADIGELGESRRYAGDAARVAEQSPHALTMTEASIAAGVLRLAEGSPAEAITPLERALAVARAGHIACAHAFSASWLALAHARCAHDREARALLDECEERRVWEHVRLEWSRIIARLAEARHRVGDERRAQALAEHALRLARAVGETAGEADALGVLGRIATRGAPRSAPA